MSTRSTFVAFACALSLFSFLVAYNFLRKLVSIFWLSYEFWCLNCFNLIPMFLQVRMWQRDSRDRTVLQPTPAAAIDVSEHVTCILSFFVFENMVYLNYDGGRFVLWGWILCLLFVKLIFHWSLVQMLPTVAYSDNPSTSFAAKFVHTSLNKNRCSINRVLVSLLKQGFLTFFFFAGLFFIIFCI